MTCPQALQWDASASWYERPQSGQVTFTFSRDPPPGGRDRNGVAETYGGQGDDDVVEGVTEGVDAGIDGILGAVEPPG
jgi:hypothetical protein